MINTPAVEVCEISHKFGKITALDNVSFQVRKGEIFTLLGPNGSGKSTLFKILSTQLYPDAGDAQVEGVSVISDPGTVRKKLGVVFQSPGLDTKLTVTENLMHQGHLYGLSGGYLKSRIESVLHLVDLVQRRDDYVGKLSGGMQKRVEIAKAILHEPSVLLLDEPTSAVDPVMRNEIFSTLRDMSRDNGITCLITTHIIDEADKADRVAVFDTGKLMTCDHPESLKKEVGGEVVEIVSSEINKLKDIVTEKLNAKCRITGDNLLRIETSNLKGRVDGYQLLAGLSETFPGIIENARVGKPTLEDVYIHFTGRSYSQIPEERDR